MSRWRRLSRDEYQCDDCVASVFRRPGGGWIVDCDRSERCPVGLLGPFGRLRDAKRAAEREHRLQERDERQRRRAAKRLLRLLGLPEEDSES